MNRPLPVHAATFAATWSRGCQISASARAVMQRRHRGKLSIIVFRQHKMIHCVWRHRTITSGQCCSTRTMLFHQTEIVSGGLLILVQIGSPADSRPDSVQVRSGALLD